jgi:uncharacterized protein YodC (DUF2158 family)
MRDAPLRKGTSMVEFKKGDTVRLKSGGPVMTVGDKHGDALQCHWFNQTGSEYTSKYDNFAPDMLRAAAVKP